MISRELFQWRVRETFSRMLQLTVALSLPLLLPACGGSSSSNSPSSPTTPLPTSNCAGSSGSVAKPMLAMRSGSELQQSPLSALTGQYFGMHIDVGEIASPPTLPWPFSGLSISTSGSPFGTIRMHDTETTWNDIDKGNGNYDFSTLDQWRSLYQNNTSQSGTYQILFTFSETPAYASSDPSSSCTSNNGNTHPAGSCAPPSDVCSDGSGTDAAFTNFVTALATHVVKDTPSLPVIHDWEIWNEPNITGFWTGTPAQLARMAQDARCVIVGTGCNSQTTYSTKGIDPTARMHTPAPVTSTDYASTDPAIDPPSGWMSAYLSAGGGQFADVVDFHGYVGANPIENVVTMVRSVQASVSAASLSLPVWDSEIGYSTTDVTDPYTQAGWLAKTYLLQAGLGIHTIAWFEFGATNIGDLYNPGSTASDGTYTTAGLDYGVLYSWMVGKTPDAPCTQSGTVWTCSFNSGANLAVWDSAQTCTPPDDQQGDCSFSTFTLPLSPVYTTYQDLQGNPHSVSGSVQVGIEPIWLIAQ